MNSKLSLFFIFFLIALTSCIRPNDDLLISERKIIIWNKFPLLANDNEMYCETLTYSLDSSSKNYQQLEALDNICRFAAMGRERIIHYGIKGSNSTFFYIYDINHTEEKDWQEIDSIELENFEITSAPQYDNENRFIFSGIYNGKESIYQFNLDTNQLSLIVERFDGFVTSPAISPTGKYLSFVDVKSQSKTMRECQLACPMRFFRFIDLNSLEEIEITNIDDYQKENSPPEIVCDLMWSPSEKFVAYEIGCGLLPEGKALIIDLESMKLVHEVEGFSSSPVQLVKWTQSDDLVFAANINNQLSSSYNLLKTNSWEIEDLTLQNYAPNDTTMVYPIWGNVSLISIGIGSEINSVSEEFEPFFLVINLAENTAWKYQMEGTKKEFPIIRALSPDDQFFMYETFSDENQSFDIYFLEIKSKVDRSISVQFPHHIDANDLNFLWMGF